MSFIKVWDESKPSGRRAKSLGDDDIREFKYAIRERLAMDHCAYEDESGHTDTGYHKILHLMVQTAITELADAGCLYTKDVDSVAELHFKDENGNELQLTSAGNLNLPATLVLITGDQTVAGVKTFTSFPVTPSEAPTTDYQVSNKKYVDDLIAAFAIEDHIGILTGTISNGETIPLPSGFTQAQCKWIVGVGTGTQSGADQHATSFDLHAYADANRVVYISSGNGNWAGTANYMIIGIK
jgi:hypothetical protein